MKEKESQFLKPKFKWDDIGDTVYQGLLGTVENKIHRMPVPGGWLLRIKDATDTFITFVPDPEHKWEGTPLP